MNTYYIELDFVRAEIKETGIAISQGDYGRVKFSIAVKKDGEIITDAASADISFQLTNGYIVQGVLSGAAGLYDYIFQGNELQAPGKTIATVTLNYADGRTSSEAFSFDVRYNPLYGRFIDAGPYITDLENIKSQAQTYVEYLEKLIEQIKLEMGQTALTKESLANNFDITEEGVKALDAAAGRALNLNKIDKTAIVQTESTDTTTVPSSAYFKQVADRVISDLTTYSSFSFTANTAGVSETNFSCLRLGRMCFVSGMMKPKIAGTPLSLGSLSIKPVNGIFFHISAFDRVGGWGTFGTDGILSCNIATTMIGENCIVNFTYVAAE